MNIPALHADCINMLESLRSTYKLSPNATLGDIDCHPALTASDESCLLTIKDEFQFLYWDMTIQEAKEAIANEPL